MAIVPLPLPPGAEARALLHHLLEHGDIVGKDTSGRNSIQLAVDDRVLETLITFDAEAADLEDGGDAEPDADSEEAPPVLLEFVWPKVVAVGGRVATATPRKAMPATAASLRSPGIHAQTVSLADGLAGDVGDRR